MDTAKIEAGVRLILEGRRGRPRARGAAGDAGARGPYVRGSAGRLGRGSVAAFDVTFDEGHEEIVLVGDIPFFSMCEHHLAPFFGKAHVAYIPGEDGASAHLEAGAARGRLRQAPPGAGTSDRQIADTLVEALHPAGVIVVLEAEHMCMSMRGVKKPGAKTTTRAVRGCFETDAAARAEALSLIFRH